jgi:hypothetical protein
MNCRDKSRNSKPYGSDWKNKAISRLFQTPQFLMKLGTNGASSLLRFAFYSGF